MATPPRFPGRISDWILHKDKQLLVFNKPTGLPVQPDQQQGPNLLGMGAAYARHDLYPIHRLDRPVSGVVAFGKKPSAQSAVSEQFKAGTVVKEYLAVVGERPPEDEATLTHQLADAPGNRTAVVPAGTPDARPAELHYRYLGGSERYHLLAVRLGTGRKHQIRVQLAEIGCPVRGDDKYGFKRANPGGGIDLHAHRLTLRHPTSDKELTFVAPVPDTPVWAAFAGLIAEL